MKKFLLLGLLLPIWLLMWCWNAKSTPEPTQPWTKTVVKKSTNEETLYYWEPAVFSQFDFTILDSNETNFLKSNNMFEDDLTASEYSKFLVVDVKYLNTSNEAFYWDWENYRYVTDSKGRKYWNISCSFYSDNCDNYNIQYKPWIPVESQIIFEIAWDSEWYYIEEKNSTTWKKYKIMLAERPIE